MKKLVDNLLHEDLSYTIHGAAIEVRKDFGPGHKEKIYQKALAEELKRRDIAFEREKAIKIHSPKDGSYIGLYRPDFIVEDKIIIEIKAEKFVSRDEIKRIYDYLRISKYELVYFINFSSPKLFVKRIIYTNERKPFVSKLLVSISLVLVFFSGLGQANAAQMFFESSSGQTNVANQPFEVILKIDPEDQNINALEGKIIVEGPGKVITVNNGNSIINLWIEEPSFRSVVCANNNCSFSFSGIIPGGYQGSLSPNWKGFKPGKVVSFVIRPEAIGVISLKLDNARVLLNDGQGTKAPLTVKSLNLIVAGAGTLSTSSADLFPKDLQAPARFKPEVVSDQNIFDGKWFLMFKTEDKDSGIDRYEILETRSGIITESAKWVIAQSPYLLKDQKLKSYIFVKAIDSAGNEQMEKVSPRNPLSWYENYSVWGIIILILFSLGFILRRAL